MPILGQIEWVRPSGAQRPIWRFTGTCPVSNTSVTWTQIEEINSFVGNRAERRKNS